MTLEKELAELGLYRGKWPLRVAGGAKALSPIRIGRSRRTSFQDTEETQEVDFNLGIRQGIEIFGIEFGIRGFAVVPGNDALAFFNAHLSVHVETGALEGAIDAFPADNFILNSEIIAETSLQGSAFTSSIPAASSESAPFAWLQPISWNYLQIFGKPLTIAQNMVTRGITSGSGLTVNGAQVTFFYRFVELSEQELAEQFVLRR